MYLKYLFLFLSFMSFSSPIYAEFIDTNEVISKKIRVGIAGNEPFVFEETNTGISIEIWEEIARQNAWNSEYLKFNSVNEVLLALENKEIDVAVGPISITADRLENISFSQPFYNSSIALISRIKDLNFWQKIKPLFSLRLLAAVGVFLIILAFVGTLLWLAERKESPEQFAKHPLKGIGTGMWLAIVTMSTTGYGDKAPITLLGRIVAGSWMVISIIFATTMVAGIANTLTLTNLKTTTISNIEQLSGKKTATISTSSSELFLSKTRVKIKAVENLDIAFDKLEKKEVEAVVFDKPQLLYFLKENHKDNLYISKVEYYKQGYGFALRENATLNKAIDISLLKLIENETVDHIIHNYIKKDE